MKLPLLSLQCGEVEEYSSSVLQPHLPPGFYQVAVHQTLHLWGSVTYRKYREPEVVFYENTSNAPNITWLRPSQCCEKEPRSIRVRTRYNLTAQAQYRYFCSTAEQHKKKILQVKEIHVTDFTKLITTMKTWHVLPSQAQFWIRPFSSLPYVVTAYNYQHWVEKHTISLGPKWILLT